MPNMKSTIYKLVKNNVIITEGSAKEMQRLRKKTPGSKVWLSPNKNRGYHPPKALKEIYTL